jgi:2-oxo-4-hydroxy-4-carboxy-5-ureidoimidazoline decarboxylase
VFEISHSAAMSTAAVLTLDALNGMDREQFRARLGDVFEDSPWVADRAWEARPFPTVEELHAAMRAVVTRASEGERLALLRAHPDLAGKAARAGAMSASSVAEQATAGLDRLTDDEFARLERLNAAYRERFGFPFIIAVRRHDKLAILAAYERRLEHTREQEIEAALGQVFEITAIRLAARVR